MNADILSVYLCSCASIGTCRTKWTPSFRSCCRRPSWRWRPVTQTPRLLTQTMAEGRRRQSSRPSHPEPSLQELQKQYMIVMLYFSYKKAWSNRDIPEPWYPTDTEGSLKTAETAEIELLCIVKGRWTVNSCANPQHRLDPGFRHSTKTDLCSLPTDCIA